MSFRRRTFQEVLDSLLTSITKGVAAEAHTFPPPGGPGLVFQISLQQPPVQSVISVFGSLNGEPHLFARDVDYKLLDDNQTLAWQEAADLPDPGSIIEVNYYPQASQPVLTDIQTGSVIRTLAETVALEIGRVYAQLQSVYDAGFIDTATGKSLDNVVSLLGIKRVAGGRAAGVAEFTRSAGSIGSINIPAGTRITTVDGNVEYETTESITLAPGQNTIRVVARDIEINDPLSSSALTVLPVPIAGIGAVTNPGPTSITTQNETDEELRARAKSFLHGSERATLGAIKQAVFRQGITADVEEIQNTPGFIEITPHAASLPPELQQRLFKSVDESRPAGVFVIYNSAQAPKKVNLSLRLTTASGLLEQDLRAAQRAAREKIEEYFARLEVKQAASVNRIVSLVLSVPQIQDARIVSASWDGTPPDVLDLERGLLKIAGFPTVLGELQITDPNLPTQLNVTVTFPTGTTPPNKAAIETALNNSLAFINGKNASESAPAVELPYGKLLLATPLPGKSDTPIKAFDETPSGARAALPTEATIAPYVVKFVFSLASGLSRILAKAQDSYSLAPFERITLSGVEIKQETGNG